MLCMLIVKASKNSEAGNLPSPELIDAMTSFNQALIEAGVRVMAKGLRPSVDGLRISFPDAGGEPEITYGPFENPGSIVAGFILIDVASWDEAVAWAKKMPDPQGFGEGEIELRRIF